MAFKLSAEAWRELVRKHKGDLPEEFLMAWINHESGGNPASLGAITEVGIFQVDMQDGARFGGDVNTLHRNFAAASSQTATRALTDAEKTLQVTSGIAMVKSYVGRVRSHLSSSGTDWPEGSSDFWSLVKWQHNLPAYSLPMLQGFKAAKGRAADTFDELASWLNALPSKPAFIDARYWNTGGPGLQKYTNNAMRVGAYGGVERLATSWIALVVAFLVLYYIGR